MLTVAKYPIKQRRKTMTKHFFCLHAQSCENLNLENGGLISLETLHTVNFTEIRLISGTFTKPPLWYQQSSILHVGQVDKRSEKL